MVVIGEKPPKMYLTNFQEFVKEHLPVLHPRGGWFEAIVYRIRLHLYMIRAELPGSAQAHIGWKASIVDRSSRGIRVKQELFYNMEVSHVQSRKAPLVIP
ncbi:hypothetical protein D3C74_383600 [compost metagenome]